MYVTSLPTAGAVADAEEAAPVTDGTEEQSANSHLLINNSLNTDVL